MRRAVAQDDLKFEAYLYPEGGYNFQLNWAGGSKQKSSDSARIHRFGDVAGLLPLPIAFWECTQDELPISSERADGEVREVDPDPRDRPEEIRRMELMVFEIWGHDERTHRPFAGAPIRSRPRRTYDPIRVIPDPEGEYIPSYLASLSRRSPIEWKRIKAALEKFGKGSELFDEISLRPFGDTDGDPFQLMIRLAGDDPQLQPRNLVDVGYGVSQSLPVLTELLSNNAHPIYLLQQPEVHLHPTAQAGLGSLFCTLATKETQLLVETHSDYLIDRIRMDVRDGGDDSSLKPEDVSILYFERNGSDVRIHPIWIDDNGNVRDAPESYGKFFMAESRRSIGL